MTAVFERATTAHGARRPPHVARVCRIISQTTNAEDTVWIAPTPRLVQESTLAIEIRRAERAYSESQRG